MPQMRVTILGARNRGPYHMPMLLSEISRTFSFAIPAPEKLTGQPVPESNFVEELNSALSQQMQRKITACMHI